ncbi:MAG: protein kinase, partial [Acidobacteriota bacterium]|nr:protein kinase [Acidobacteriota bacterium]
GETEYLVMELLEGETLSDRLAKGPLPLEQTLRYGADIADALDKAHRQGIVHRDLKPGNVMLTKSGVKLLDFGLAKAFERPLDTAGREQAAAAHDPMADNTRGPLHRQPSAGRLRCRSRRTSIPLPGASPGERCAAHGRGQLDCRAQEAMTLASGSRLGPYKILAARRGRDARPDSNR